MLLTPTRYFGGADAVVNDETGEYSNAQTIFSLATFSWILLEENSATGMVTAGGMTLLRRRYLM